jgi:hypothetical protein
MVLIALWAELRPADEVMHPFAVRPIPAGTAVTPSDVELRAVPADLLAPVSLPQTAGHQIRTGDPIIATNPAPKPPPDWWALEIRSPASVAPGDRVRIVITNRPALSTIGIVLGSGEAFGEPTALVAVAEEWADLVATAVQEDRALLMVSS